MRTLFRTMLILACCFSFLENAQSDAGTPDMESSDLPLLQLGHSITIFSRNIGITELPAFIPPALVTKIDPTYYTDANKFKIPIDSEGARAELLTAMNYNSKDQLFMVFQNKEMKTISLQKDLFKTSMETEKNFSSVALIPDIGPAWGFAWIGTTSPFKKDPQIKTIDLMEQKPQYSKTAKLTQKLIERSILYIGENLVSAGPLENLKCEGRPAMSVKYGDLEFFAVRAHCTGIKEPRETSQIYVTRGNVLKSLSFQGNASKEPTNALKVTVFDILKDYQIMLKLDSDAFCDEYLLRDTKGYWKVVTPICEPRRC